MNNVRVLLIDQSGNEYDVSYIEEIPLSLNLLIAEVRQPDKRNSTFSKTITFPGTKEINKFFELIWQCNIDLTKFDPRNKCAIYYYVNEIEQLKGDLQLLQVNVDFNNKIQSYECSASGRLGNLFLDIGDSLLTDLDFSEYDHTLNRTNVTNSWATSIIVNGGSQAFALGSGYTYPLIDYGYNNTNMNSEFHVKYLRPAIYKKTILDKIFTAAGKTYTSSYFDSTYYKRQIVPATEENILLSSTDRNNSQFYAGRTGSQQLLNTTLTYDAGPGAWYTPNALTFSTVIFNDDSTSPFNDAGGQYNTGTGTFTVGVTNQYTLSYVIDYDLLVNNASADHIYTGGTIYHRLEKWNGSAWGLAAAGSTSMPNAAYAATNTSTFQAVLSYGNVAMTAGDQYRVRIGFNFASFPFIIYDVANNPVTTGTTSVDLRVKTTSIFYLNLDSQVITEGYTVEMNQAVPTNIKQLDWLMSEFKLANLYMDIDKDNENNYIIEPRDDFYSGDEVDWTDKLDISKGTTVLPVGDLNYKRYEFTYKPDSDEYNDQFFKEYKQVYGFGKYDVTGDFIKDTNKTEVIYSATPVVGNSSNGLVIPKIRQYTNGAYRNFKANIRSLYYGGVINISHGSWTLKSSSGDLTYTTYPYAGHSDNPYNPTIDLSWDIPSRVYYTYPTASYTDNNLKNRYYTRFLNQITDKNSKILKAWFKLSAKDINSFDFRKTVFIGHPINDYFYVNAIRDYNVLNQQSTLVELLKLTEYDAYTPDNEMSLPENPPTGAERVINQNITTGTNNVNLGTSSVILGGSGNFIAEGGESVTLIDCENVIVEPGLTNFTGIGLSNTTFDSTYTGRTIAPNTGLTTETKTADFTVAAGIDLYFVDCTAGDVTISWDAEAIANKTITFKRIDTSANVLYITNSSGGNYDDNATPVTTGITKMQALTVYSNGTTLYSLSNRN